MGLHAWYSASRVVLWVNSCDICSTCPSLDILALCSGGVLVHQTASCYRNRRYRLLTYSIIYVSASLTTPTPPLPPPKKEKQNNEVFHVKPTCGNLEGFTGNAVTQV